MMKLFSSYYSWFNPISFKLITSLDDLLLHFSFHIYFYPFIFQYTCIFIISFFAFSFLILPPCIYFWSVSYKWKCGKCHSCPCCARSWFLPEADFWSTGARTVVVVEKCSFCGSAAGFIGLKQPVCLWSPNDVYLCLRLIASCTSNCLISLLNRLVGDLNLA